MSAKDLKSEPNLKQKKTPKSLGKNFHYDEKPV